MGGSGRRGDSAMPSPQVCCTRTRGVSVETL
jgi:hypothetical protein